MGESTGTAKRALRRGTRATSGGVVRTYRAEWRPNCEKKRFERNKLMVDVGNVVYNVPVGGPNYGPTPLAVVSLQSQSGPGNSRKLALRRGPLASEATFLTDTSQSDNEDDRDLTECPSAEERSDVSTRAQCRGQGATPPPMVCGAELGDDHVDLITFS